VPSKKCFFFSLLLLISCFVQSQTNNPPSISAIGNQPYCNGSSITIVTDFTITDADDSTIDAFYIQISKGYQINFDQLTLLGSHPTINTSWNASEGKLTLFSAVSTSKIQLTDLETAVKQVFFRSTATNIEPEKTFSLTIDNTNYLPTTGHFYQFIAAPGISWSNAKTAAENRTYYGRQGYLATLTSQEEANFAGKQASGPGWIGGSDEETEGVWKWLTGPEAGTNMANFWNGQVNGSTPNFANWNNNEPNDFGGNEDYAHITDPTIGTPGAWNDLPNEGGGGLYLPKGYIVEYGTHSDGPLNIVASTRIYIPQISTTTAATICEGNVATITATSNEGTILWYKNASGGSYITSGNSFTTPILNSSTSYYAVVSVNGCTNNLPRTEITVTVNKNPIITSVTDDLICQGQAILSATSSVGDVYWYESATSTTHLYIGANFTTPFLSNSTSYFVAAKNGNCSTVNRTEVKATVNNTVPEFSLENKFYYLCDNSGTVTLNTINANDNYTYIWSKDKIFLNENTPTITVNETGTYTVSAISLFGCESEEKQIIVSNSNKAIFTDDSFILIDDSENNSLEIIPENLGIGNYIYSLDDEFGLYTDEVFFENISTGVHQLYVKDINGCGTSVYKFSVLAYPKYFTPNGDGINDVWSIEGYNTSSFTGMKLFIYDRFGNLLFKTSAASGAWNGIYQGKLLPANTYWFQVIINDINGNIINENGSFSLVR